MKKSKFWKLLVLPFLVCSLIFVQTSDVLAASFSVKASKSSVNPGGSFTVNVSVEGAGKFSVSVSNGSASSSSLWIDGSGQVNVTAGSSGKTTVTVTAVDATGFDESPITGSQSVSVNIVSNTGGGNTGGGNTGGSSTPKPKPVDNRSKDNNLSSLTISEGTLSPEFSASVTDYTVELPASTTSLTVGGKASDSKASVSGLGEVSLNAGENIIKVTVTAENGNPKVYTIHANVDETPLIFTKYGEDELGVVRNLNNVPSLDGFEETSVTLENEEVKAWYSPVRNITVVYLQKGDEKNFYLYDEEKGIVSIYVPLGILGHNLGIVDVPVELQSRAGMTYQMVTVEEMEIMGWVYDDESFANYCLIYAMDEQGEYHYYQYESSLSSLQLYSGAAAVTQDEFETVVKDLNTKTMMLYVSLGACVVFLGGMIYGFVSLNRYKKRLFDKNDSLDSK